MLGLIASTLDDFLINHVTYTWIPPVSTAAPTFPSVAKALMDKLHLLFGTTSLAGQFLLFQRVMQNWVHPRTANENISSLIQLFDQLHQAGLDLPQSFCAMILLSHLPDNMFTLASTITQTVAVANFNLETVASRILAEICRSTGYTSTTRFSDFCNTVRRIFCQQDHCHTAWPSTSKSLEGSDQLLPETAISTKPIWLPEPTRLWTSFTAKT